MIVEILTNQVIIAGFLGAFASWVLATTTEHVKFNNAKKGAYALIKSEILSILTYLKNYKTEFLLEEIIIKKDEPVHKDLPNFYMNLRKFPDIRPNNWNNLSNFIPRIFNENEINAIVKFFMTLEELNKKARYLSTLNAYNTQKFGEYEITTLNDTNWINNYRNDFRNELIELINMGEEILEFFK